MSDDESTPTSADPATSPDYRQLAFVGFVALALLAAAAVVPAATDPGTDAPDGNGPSGGDGDPPAGDGAEGDPGDGPDVSFDIEELLEWFDLGGGGGGDTTADDRPCTLLLDRQPTPGGEVTAMVRYEGEPIEGATVRFNDRRIGRTDGLGRVTGEVPYDDSLRIRVDLPERPDCEFVSATGQSVRGGNPVGSVGTAAPVG